MVPHNRESLACRHPAQLLHSFNQHYCPKLIRALLLLEPVEAVSSSETPRGPKLLAQMDFH